MNAHDECLNAYQCMQMCITLSDWEKPISDYVVSELLLQKKDTVCEIIKIKRVKLHHLPNDFWKFGDVLCITANLKSHKKNWKRKKTSDDENWKKKQPINRTNSLPDD